MFDGWTLTGGALALGTGLLLGAFFFWGLWWTSRRVLFVRAPGLLLAASFVVRMAVLLGGVWFVTRGRLLDTAFSVVGMLIARRIVIGTVQSSDDTDGATEVQGGGD